MNTTQPFIEIAARLARLALPQRRESQESRVGIRVKVPNLPSAHELAKTMIEHFSGPDGFYDTSDDHETLIVRPRELQDNAVPSGRIGW